MQTSLFEMSPTISVITVVKNGVAQIASCVQSVQSAGFEDFEHVLVDGGSTDGSQDLLRRFQCTTPSVRVFEIPDKSMTEGLRNACSMSMGEWILPLNVDDNYFPGGGARLEAYLKSTYASMVVWDTILMRHNGRAKFFERPWSAGLSWTWDLMGCFITECGVAMRRSDLLDLGGYDLRYRLAADYDLYRRFAASRKIEYLPVLLGIFNLTTQNVSHVQREVIIAEAAAISRWGRLYGFFLRHRIDKLLRVLLRLQCYDMSKW